MKKKLRVCRFEILRWLVPAILAVALCSAPARAVEPWESALSSMPLPRGMAELNMTNCIPAMLTGLRSNSVVKGLVFMPGATDEFYFFRRAKASVTNESPTMLDAVNALKNQTRITATFRPPLLLLHTAEDSLEPVIQLESSGLAEKIKATRFDGHALFFDRDWDAMVPTLRGNLKAEILPAKYSPDSWHFYRHCFAGWNLTGWEALEAVLFAGKTTCRMEKQGGLSLRRTLITFELDKRRGKGK